MNLDKMRESQFECKKRAYENHMDKLREKSFGVNERLQLIRISNRKLNCLRWGSNETKGHIWKKLEICRWLKEINHVFISEGIFNNGARCDVVDLTGGVIYEVLCSEKEESFEKKIKKYPEVFRVVKI